MKKMAVILVVVPFIFLAATAFADENLWKATDIVRRSSEMFGTVSKSVSPEKLASKLKERSSTSFGFAAGSAEASHSFFSLGAALADLEAALSSGNTGKSLMTLNSLEGALKQVNAGSSFVESVKALSIAINQGIAPRAVSKSGLQALRPFLEEIAGKSKVTYYFRLGEWAETAKVVLQTARDEDNSALASAFLKEFNYADRFLSGAGGGQLPRSAEDALKEIKGLGDGKGIDGKKLRKSLKALDTIIEVMG